jgi:hypothetical protein
MVVAQRQNRRQLVLLQIHKPTTKVIQYRDNCTTITNQRMNHTPHRRYQTAPETIMPLKMKIRIRNMYNEIGTCTVP